MTQLPEPTFWEWVSFAVVMTCLAYGIAVVVLDRLPEWMSAALRQLLFRTIPGLAIEALRLASWAFAWFGAGLIWVLSAGRVPVVDDLLKRSRPAPAADPGAPVSRIMVSLPASYVAGAAEVSTLERNDMAVAATGDELRNAIAMGDAERNEPLTRNVLTRAQADIIARLLRSESLYIPDGRGGYKRVGQVAMIQLATGLTPNGRPESDYGQLKAELDPLLSSTVTVRGPDGAVRTISKATS